MADRQPDPTEVTTRYARGGLPDLSAAWAFVMDKLDSVGPDPEVKISPVWTISGDGDDQGRTFTAVVSGMVTEEPTDE